MKKHDHLQRDRLEELLLQTLETEQGGIKVYEAALECTVNEDLRAEWQTYLDQTRKHVDVVRGLMRDLGFDPSRSSPGREVVKHLGESLVQAIREARTAAGKHDAQIVAAECVVLAETKDHQNWGLIGVVARRTNGKEGETLREAQQRIEEEEDEHLHHSAGWARELWIEALGISNVLPPPEEEQDVRTAIGAARAKLAPQTL